jgi:hypothetical protein
MNNEQSKKRARNCITKKTQKMRNIQIKNDKKLINLKLFC